MAEEKTHKLKEFEKVQDEKVQERFGFIFDILGELNNVKRCVFHISEIDEALKKVSEIKYPDDKGLYIMTITAEKEMKGKFERLSRLINGDSKIKELYPPASILIGENKNREVTGVMLVIKFDIPEKVDAAIKNNKVLISEIKKIILEEERFLDRK